MTKVKIYKQKPGDNPEGAVGKYFIWRDYLGHSGLAFMCRDATWKKITEFDSSDPNSPHYWDNLSEAASTFNSLMAGQEYEFVEDSLTEEEAQEAGFIVNHADNKGFTPVKKQKIWVNKQSGGEYCLDIVENGDTKLCLAVHGGWVNPSLGSSSKWRHGSLEDLYAVFVSHCNPAEFEVTTEEKGFGGETVPVEELMEVGFLPTAAGFVAAEPAINQGTKKNSLKISEVPHGKLMKGRIPKYFYAEKPVIFFRPVNDAGIDKEEYPYGQLCFIPENGDPPGTLFLDDFWLKQVAEDVELVAVSA
jgi:hypothetical protein